MRESTFKYFRIEMHEQRVGEFRFHVGAHAAASSHSREAWLRAHRAPGTITASQVPTILGLNPYQTPRELWKEIAIDFDKEDKPNVAMRRGHALEPLMDELIREYHPGAGITDLGDYATIAMNVPYEDGSGVMRLLVTPDRLGMKDGCLYEMKAPARWPSKESWAAYEVQLHMQMYVSGWSTGRIVTLAGNDFNISQKYLLTSAKIDMIEQTWIPKLMEFAKCCLTKVPPPKIDRDKEGGPLPKPDPTKGVLEAKHLQGLAGEYVLLNAMAADIRGRLSSVRDALVKRINGHPEAHCGRYVVRASEIYHNPSIKVEASLANQLSLETSGVEYKMIPAKNVMQLRVTDKEEADYASRNEDQEAI